MRRELVEFVEAHENCFERSLQIGHVTGSAWIVDPDRTHTLLHHHGKLDRWLQLGGHADGDSDVRNVALREAREESGLTSVRPVSADIFDVDVHCIPARGAEPEHFHYDVRYLFEADRSEPLRITNESKDLQWVRLDRVEELTQEESILRMVRKMGLGVGRGERRKC
jgi:8-oxo-dGTP pyrophosphatase MutT (NUDIX family)